VPVRNSTNNRILPANARAADVVEKAIQEIIPIQQAKTYAAFRAQGFECNHYSRLLQGRKCSCQATGKQLNGILGQDGKASAGDINSMLTGNMEFTITQYEQPNRKFPGNTTQTSPDAPVNKFQGEFSLGSSGDDGDFPFEVISDGIPDFHDNGPIEQQTIDDLAGDFDASVLGFSDVACPVCFGSGFIGGFSPLNSQRIVLTVADVKLSQEGEIDTVKRPWTARAKSFAVIVKLPRGAISVDVLRVWNMAKPANATFQIDGIPVNSVTDVLNACDGGPHVLFAEVNGEFTHLEMQFGLSTESVFFEFPKRSFSSDTSLLEQMEPFQIIMSPNLPTVASRDIIVESQLGKVLIVQSVDPWESRQRNLLGWNMQVRVIQPQELFRILPTRGRIMSKDRTTLQSRDNVSGKYRT
jgi:hypothetical protein